MTTVTTLVVDHKHGLDVTIHPDEDHAVIALHAAYYSDGDPHPDNPDKWYEWFIENPDETIVNIDTHELPEARS